MLYELTHNNNDNFSLYTNSSVCEQHHVHLNYGHFSSSAATTNRVSINYSITIQHMEKINSLIFRYCTCMNIEELKERKLNLHQNAGLARFDKWIEELRKKVKALLHGKTPSLKHKRTC